MRIEQITKEQFGKLQKEGETYFRNGVLFREADDNVLGFLYDERPDVQDDVFTYWKVVRDSKSS